MTGPPGTQTAVAFAYVSTEPCTTPATPPACGYEADYRYVLSATPLTQDFRLRRISGITAGESTVLTVEPHDTICVNNVQDMHPWPTEFICRTVRIVAPVDGVMTIEAIPANAGALLPDLEVETVVAMESVVPSEYKIPLLFRSRKEPSSKRASKSHGVQRPIIRSS
jgi:hypothetical protein